MTNGGSVKLSVVDGRKLSIADFKDHFRKLGCEMTSVYEL